MIEVEAISNIVESVINRYCSLSLYRPPRIARERLYRDGWREMKRDEEGARDMPLSEEER